MNSQPTDIDLTTPMKQKDGSPNKFSIENTFQIPVESEEGGSCTKALEDKYLRSSPPFEASDEFRTE